MYRRVRILACNVGLVTNNMVAHRRTSIPLIHVQNSELQLLKFPAIELQVPTPSQPEDNDQMYRQGARFLIAELHADYTEPAANPSVPYTGVPWTVTL